jgi:hypothetical protein
MAGRGQRNCMNQKGQKTGLHAGCTLGVRFQPARGRIVHTTAARFMAHVAHRTGWTHPAIFGSRITQSPALPAPQSDESVLMVKVSSQGEIVAVRGAAWAVTMLSQNETGRAGAPKESRIAGRACSPHKKSLLRRNP